MTDEFISELCEILTTTDNKITDLDLQGARLSDEGCRTVCKLLRESTTIMSLDLSANRCQNEWNRIDSAAWPLCFAVFAMFLGACSEPIRGCE